MLYIDVVVNENIKWFEYLCLYGNYIYRKYSFNIYDIDSIIILHNIKQFLMESNLYN